MKLESFNFSRLWIQYSLLCRYSFRSNVSFHFVPVIERNFVNGFVYILHDIFVLIWKFGVEVRKNFEINDEEILVL